MHKHRTSKVILNKKLAAEIYEQKLSIVTRIAYDSCFKDLRALIRGKSSKVSVKYGVSPKTVRDIWNRHTWTNATGHLWERESQLTKVVRQFPASDSGSTHQILSDHFQTMDGEGSTFPFHHSESDTIVNYSAAKSFNVSFGSPALYQVGKERYTVQGPFSACSQSSTAPETPATAIESTAAIDLQIHHPSMQPLIEQVPYNAPPPPTPYPVGLFRFPGAAEADGPMRALAEDPFHFDWPHW